MRRANYIINRILIGVGIALLLAFLKKNFVLQVNALGISSYSTGGINTVVSTLDSEVSLTVQDNPWANWRYGYLYFDFSFNKVNGTATSALVFPRSAVACSGSTCYICSIGSASTNNSTFDVSTFSAKCAMDLQSDGLTSVKIQLNDFQSNAPSDYRVRLGSLMTYEQIAETSIDISSINQQTQSQMQNDNANTQSIINNQDSNTQDIIDSQEDLTQDIIDSQTQNTQDIIDSNQVCTYIDKNKGVSYGTLNSSTGDFTSSQNTTYITTDFISISSSDKLTLLEPATGTGKFFCFYDTNKTKISCNNTANMTSNSDITIPSNSSYFRATIVTSTNHPSYQLCRNGNQAINDSLGDLNNTINDSNVGTANAEMSEWFSNFTFNDHGLSTLATAPLRLIASLTGTACEPLSFYLPFMPNNRVELPCVKSAVYERYPTFLSLWQLITTGLIAYHVVINILRIFKDLINPFSTRIEVLNL